MYNNKKTHVKFPWNYIPGGPISTKRSRIERISKQILRMPIGGGGILIPGGKPPRAAGAI